MTEIKDTGNREIDLLELLVRIFRTLGNWIIRLFTWLLSSLIFLFKNWVYLSLSIILGVALALVLHNTLKPVYSTEMTVRSNTLPNADMINYVNNLHDFCQTGNKGALCRALNINPEMAGKIKDIRAFWVIDKNRDNIPDYVDYRYRFNVYDTLNTRMQDRFVIRIRFLNLSDLQSIRSGLFTYVKDNDYFRQQNDVRLQMVDELITRLTYDIRQLDSLQKIKYYEETKNMVPQKNGQMVFLQEQKTQLVYEDIYKLYDRKQSLTREKAINAGLLSVISDFSLPEKPYRSLIYYAIFTVPAFFLFTLLVLILVINKENLKELFRKY